MAEPVVTPAEKPIPPALRVVRTGFAGLLVFSLVFCIVMAAWGDLRDAMFVRVLDHRFAKSFVIAAPEGAKVWLGDQYLGVSEKPPMHETEPDLVIDGLSVSIARVYAEEVHFMKNARLFAAGESVTGLLQHLAPGRRLVFAQSERLTGPGQVVPVLLREGELVDAACLCTLEIPQRQGNPQLFAYLLRVQQEQRHWISACTFTIGSMRLWAPPGEFWTQRQEVEGFPADYPRGQCRTAWRMFPTLATTAEQTSLLQAQAVSDPKWVTLAENKK
ncbi:MAG: hypothetical protein IPP14_10830 [Planctomycetes bacterium]|nr:hypothetical protein [Planctomycetota bacterium]